MRHAAPIIAAILLLLPVLYVGSYLALVNPEQDWQSSSGRHTYRASPQYCATIFWPLEQIDRRLRPGAWINWKLGGSGGVRKMKSAYGQRQNPAP